jgi:hypothetical protein
VLGRAVVLAAALEGHRQVLAGLVLAGLVLEALVLAGAQAASARQVQAARAAKRTHRDVRALRSAARRSADSLRDRA